jgi:Protein of unknown function (DUF3540)
MKNLARKLHDDPVFQEIGTVTRASGSSYDVATASSTVEARRAASCLIEPAVGDRVIIGGSASEGSYVLAILRREVDASTAISVDGDLEVRAKGGRFVVATRDGIDLVSSGDVSVVSARVDVNAADSNVTLGRLTFFGALMRAEIEKIKLFAETFDSVVERVAQRVQRSYRTITETDHVRAERIDYVAEKTASVHGENALVTARELVKIDAEQIHVG